MSKLKFFKIILWLNPLRGREALKVFAFTHPPREVMTRLRRGIGALPVMLLLGAIVIEIAIVGAATAILRNNVLLSTRAGAAAFYTARGGVQDGILQITRNKNFSSSGYTATINGNIATIVVTKDQPVSGESTVTASSSVFGRIKKVQAIVNVDSLGQVNAVSFGEIAN